MPRAVWAQAPPPEAPSGACTIVGPLLGPNDFGIPAGQPVADATAALLPDGRGRLYTYAQGRGVVSAISLTAEGASFEPEAGSRPPDGSGMPRIVANPSGGWRLFFSSGGGITSAVSTDGLTFTIENGFRITQEAAGFSGTTVSATTGPTVIGLADGRYRDTYDLFFGNDRDALRLSDGTLVMYDGAFDAQVGGTINLARCPEPAAAAASRRRRAR